jgi:hypothetical protein
MANLEIALSKASEDPKLDKVLKEISKNLVRVYTAIAQEHQD